MRLSEITLVVMACSVLVEVLISSWLASRDIELEVTDKLFAFRFFNVIAFFLTAFSFFVSLLAETASST